MTARACLRLLSAIALAILVVGCPSLFGRPRKAPTSALWLAEPSDAVAGPEMRRLETAGVREVFLEAGELRSAGAELSIVARGSLSLPRRIPVTLVLRGGLPAEPAISGRLIEEARRFMVGAEGAGLLVVGLHLDLEVAGTIGDLAELATALRRALPDGRYLSATVDRRWLGEEGLARLAKATDFWVVFLHGEREGGTEVAASWDLQVTERDLQRVEQAGEPYFVGVVTLGTATRVGRDGRSTPLPASLAIYPLLTHPALELVPGFSLQGVDRQVLELRSRAAAKVGGLDLASGERLRIVRTPTAVLEELQRLLRTWELPHRLGELFYRLPEAADRLSLSAGSLAAALEPGAAEPQLAVELDSLGAERGRFRFRVRLRGENDEATDVATLDHNFVWVHVPGGVITDAEPGDFLRIEVDRVGEGSRVAAVRRPDVVRLFAPMMEGRGELASGPIEVRFEGRTMRVAVAADFVLPDGRVLTLPAREWELTP